MKPIIENEYSTFTITLEQVVRIECHNSQDPEKIVIDHLYVSSPKELTGFSATYGRIKIKTESVDVVKTLKHSTTIKPEAPAKEIKSELETALEIFDHVDELDIF